MNNSLLQSLNKPDQLETVLKINAASNPDTMYAEWLQLCSRQRGILNAGVIRLQDARCYPLHWLFNPRTGIEKGTPAVKSAAGVCMLNNIEVSGCNVPYEDGITPGILTDTMNRWVYALPVNTGDERYCFTTYFSPQEIPEQQTLDFLKAVSKTAESKLNAFYWQNKYHSLRDTGRNSIDELEKEFDNFRYSVSHDLRAPLRAIKGFTDILVEDHPELLNGETEDLARRIVRNTDYMAELIHDLQEYYRAGKKELVKLKVPMQLIVEEVFEKLHNEEKSRYVSFSAKGLHECFVDSDLIREVWHVLVSNALKYTAKKDRTEITVGSEKKGNEVIYFIKDNGVGFDSLQSGKLFNVFQRLHARKDYDGTGMGLAIADKIVRRHGGRMWAESELNNGAIFYFSVAYNTNVNDTAS